MLSRISTGTLLKTEIGNDSEIGQQAKGYVESSTLVPDVLINSLIKSALKDNTEARIIFDGFPKTLDQAKKLDEMCTEYKKKLYGVIYLDVPDDKLLARMTGKRVHLKSGRTYHLLYNPPKKAGKDDVTGEALIQPDDSKEETVKKTISEFHKTMDPIIKYFEEKGSLRKVNGDLDIDGVWELVKKEVDAAMEVYNADKKERLEKEMNSDGEGQKKEADAAKAEEAGEDKKAT